MSWVVRAPARELRGDEKRLYTRARRVLWGYEPLRASRVEVRHGIVYLRGDVPSDSVEQAAVEVASSVPQVASVRSALTRGGESLSPVSLPRLSDPEPQLQAEVHAGGSVLPV